MRRWIVWILWLLASGYGLWRGIRLAFLPVAIQATTPVTPAGAAPAPEILTPVFFVAGIPILLALLALYSVLGYTLYRQEHTAFRILTGLHVVLSVVGVSIGWLFLPSSVLLLLAALMLSGSTQPIRLDGLHNHQGGL